MQYGAVGNGKHDDTKAVQEALNAASGGVLDLPADKTFLCTHTLTIGKDTTVRGAGIGSQLKFSWSNTRGRSSGGRFYFGTSLSSNVNTSNVTLDNFSLQGASSGLPSGPNSINPDGLVTGIDLHNIHRYQLSGLDVYNMPGVSVAIRGGSDGRITDNDIHNSGHDGINATWWNAVNLTNLVISHNTIAKMGDDAMDISGTPGQGMSASGRPNNSSLPFNIDVSDNTISGWPTNVNGKVLGRGMFLRAITNSQITDNKITDTADDGILLTGSHNLKEDYNPATRLPWESTNVQILNNTIQGAGQLSPGTTVQITKQPTYGVQIQDSSRVTFTGNKVTDSLSQNIDIKSCENRCVIHSNQT